MEQLADSIQAYDLQNILLIAQTVKSELKLQIGISSMPVAVDLSHASLEAAKAVVTQCREEQFAKVADSEAFSI